jgi:hypothetical protein
VADALEAGFDAGCSTALSLLTGALREVARFGGSGLADAGLAEAVFALVVLAVVVVAGATVGAVFVLDDARVAAVDFEAMMMTMRLWVGRHGRSGPRSERAVLDVRSHDRKYRVVIVDSLNLLDFQQNGRQQGLAKEQAQIHCRSQPE